MTTFGKNAKNPYIRSKLDEIDLLINACSLRGDKETVERLQKFKEAISDFSQLFDSNKNKSGTVLKLEDEQTSDSQENDE